MSYATLESDRGHLKGKRIEPAGEILPEDVADAERWAQTEIEETLGKRWSLTAIPDTVAKLAEDLAAGWVLERIYRNGGQGLEDAQKLVADARAELVRIRAHARGILMPDGTWDPDYPGSRNLDEGRTGGVRIIL